MTIDGSADAIFLLLSSGSHGSIDNNSIAMGSNQGGTGILVKGQLGAGPSSADVVANRISGTAYVDGINIFGRVAVRLFDNLIVGQASIGVSRGGVVLQPVLGDIDATVVNNTISGNETGIVVLFENGSTVGGLVANNIVSGNETGISIPAVTATTLENRDNLVFGNGVDSFTPGPGTVTEDPRFAGPGDYHLGAGSPAIDAGDDSAVPGDLTTDLDGSPRIQGSHVDLGAFETVPEPTTLLSGGATLLALHALGRRTHARTASCWRRR